MGAKQTLPSIIIERDNAVSEKHRAITERDLAVSIKTRTIAELDIAVFEKHRAVTERDVAVSEKRRAIAERDSAVSEKRLAITERDDAVSEKHRAIAERDSAVSEKRLAITERDNAVSEKHQAITKLDNAVSEKLRAINQVLDSLLPGDTSMNIGSDYIPASSNVPEGWKVCADVYQDTKLISQNIDFGDVSNLIRTTKVTTYTIRYAVTYNVGCEDVYKTQNILIYDKIPPKVHLNGPDHIIHILGTEYVDEGATATDTSNLPVSVVATHKIDINTEGVYTIDYVATDAYGNTTGRARKVVVAPRFTISLSDGIEPNMTVEVGASVNIDPKSDTKNNMNGSVNFALSGTYRELSKNENIAQITADTHGSTVTVEYKGIDSHDRQETIRRTITFVDTSPPLISLTGKEAVRHEIGTAYADEGARSDTRVVTVNNVNSNEIGDYAVTYTATDAAGNTSIQKRNVTVVDTTPPKITLNGESTVYHCQHDVYNDAGVTVKDNSGKSIQPTTTSNVDVANPGKYTVQYVATDESENSTFVARTVYVVTYVIWETYEVSINRDGAAKKYTFHVEYDKRHKITWRAHMEMQPEHHGYYVTHMVFDFNLLEFISDAKLKRIENNVGNHPGMETTIKRIRADAPDPNLWNGGRTSLDLFLGFWSDDWLMSIFAEKGAGSFFGHEAHFVKSDQQSKPDLSKLAELMVHKSSKQKQAPVRLHHLVAGIGATESASSTV